MTLTEQLMQADVETVNKLRTGTFRSKRLQRVTGADDLVEITIKELAPSKINSIRKGSDDDFDIYKNICLEGIIEPNVKDNALMKHFQCSSPISLIEKIFSVEIPSIANAIVELSEFATEEDQKNEVKN